METPLSFLIKEPVTNDKTIMSSDTRPHIGNIKGGLQKSKKKNKKTKRRRTRRVQESVMRGASSQDQVEKNCKGKVDGGEGKVVEKEEESGRKGDEVQDEGSPSSDQVPEGTKKQNRDIQLPGGRQFQHTVFTCNNKARNILGMANILISLGLNGDSVLILEKSGEFQGFPQLLLFDDIPFMQQLVEHLTFGGGSCG